MSLHKHQQSLTIAIVVCMVTAILIGYRSVSGNQNNINLPYYGMFLMAQDGLVELMEGKGSTLGQGIPSTTNVQPTIYAWVPDLNWSLVVLAPQSGTGSIQFTQQPLSDGVLAIQPRAALADGRYCFREGNPNLPFSLLRNWCFDVNTGQSNQQQSSETNSGQSSQQPSQATSVPPLVFVSFAGNNADVFTFDGNVHQVTSNSGNNFHPDWSPDGAEIAFDSNRDNVGKTDGQIYVINSDGTNVRRLTDSGNCADPDWSPDGIQIAFTSNRTGYFEIYAMNNDGSDQRQITSLFGGSNQPSWSPDGKELAVSSYLNGNRDIYLVNTDGSNVRRLTDDPAEDWSPNWSPDGTEIAFATTRDGHYNVYLMNSDGSNQRRLTTASGDNGQYELSWSPDGQFVAYTTAQGIFWINVSTGLVQSLGGIPFGITPAFRPSANLQNNIGIDNSGALRVAYSNEDTSAVEIQVTQVTHNSDGSISAAITLHSKSAISYGVDFTIATGQVTGAIEPLVPEKNPPPVLTGNIDQPIGTVTFMPGSVLRISFSKLGFSSSDASMLLAFDFLTALSLAGGVGYLPVKTADEWRKIGESAAEWVVGLLQNPGFDTGIFTRQLQQDDIIGAFKTLGTLVASHPDIFTNYLLKEYGITISNSVLKSLGGGVAALLTLKEVAPVVADLVIKPNQVTVDVVYSP